MNKEELKLLNYQQITTALFIISLFISLLLTYNDKLELTNNNEFLSNSDYYKISVFNRLLVFILSLSFLYINYNQKEISKRKGRDITPNKLQIAASDLSVIASLIVLYVVITSGDYSVITASGNPNL